MDMKEILQSGRSTSVSISFHPDFKHGLVRMYSESVTTSTSTKTIARFDPDVIPSSILLNIDPAIRRNFDTIIMYDNSQTNIPPPITMSDVYPIVLKWSKR
jgi:hypothetical protein